MKNLVTLVALVVIAFCIHKFHNENVKEAAEKAAAEARADALRSIPKKVKPAPRQAVAISKMIEPWYLSLFSDLNRNKPEDLVPPLTIAKERVLDSKSMVEREKHPIYDMGVKVLSSMIDAAEERTKAIEAMMQAAANDKSSLDSENTISASKSFFAQSTMRRWEDEKRRRKVAIDQLFAQLRSAERVWNSTIGKDAVADSYDLAGLVPVLVSVDNKIVGGSSLEKGAYNQTRTMYPWRRTYYDQYSGTQYYR